MTISSPLPRSLGQTQGTGSTCTQGALTKGRKSLRIVLEFFLPQRRKFRDDGNFRRDVKLKVTKHPPSVNSGVTRPYRLQPWLKPESPKELVTHSVSPGESDFNSPGQCLTIILKKKSSQVIQICPMLKNTDLV